MTISRYVRRAAGLILVSSLMWLWSISPAMAEEANDPWLPRDRTVWGLSGAVGVAAGDRAKELGSFAIDMSRTLTDPVGPGWLRGRMGVVVEIVPLFLLSEHSTAYGAGFNLLGRHYLDRGGSLRPFITLGAGMLVSAEEIPDHVANLNFTPQAGMGFLFFDKGGRLYSVECRFQHVSNGGRVQPNPGINSAVFQFAVLFPGRHNETP